MGGWGAVVVKEDGSWEKCNGCEAGANQMKMIIKAAIGGLSKTAQDCEAKICSNIEYLVLGINDSLRREKNRELWAELEELLSRRHVKAKQISSKEKWLKEAQELAKDAIKGRLV